MGTVVQIKQAVRAFRRAPRLSIAAVLCIAIGMAATGSVATLINLTTIKPLPFPHADRLVRIWNEEIGVRLSFGAKPSHIFGLFLRQGLLLAFLGLGVGIVVALALGQSMSSLLVGITAVDPATYVIIAVLFVLVAVAACLFPAWRATRVDPMHVLRYE